MRRLVLNAEKRILKRVKLSFGKPLQCAIADTLLLHGMCYCRFADRIYHGRIAAGLYNPSLKINHNEGGK